MKSITLPGPAAAFVSAGGRDVDTVRITMRMADCTPTGDAPVLATM